MLKNYVFLLLICLRIYFSLAKGTRSGPFKSLLVRTGPCDAPTQPLDPDPPSQFWAEVYNTTGVNLMRGNVTILRHHRIKKMKAKSYIWENNRWKVNYLINNMGCNRVFFPVLCMATGVKYEPKTCSFNKGVYNYENFDLNKIQHMYMATQEYGKILWKIEVSSFVGTVFCYDFETLIEAQ